MNQVWRGLVVLLVVLPEATLWAQAPRLPLGLNPESQSPASNPVSPAKVALGRRLFFDPFLSGDHSRSCATCHELRRAFADGRRLAVGVGGSRGERNVPTLVNRAWATSFFWDGRTTVLEQQVLEPLWNPRELGISADAALEVIRSPRYLSSFRSVFGEDPSLNQLALSLACYVRTIVSADSPYDRFEAGDRGALSHAAAQGRAVFRLLGGCSACHNGPNLTDEEFHNTGIGWRNGALRDAGRSRVTRSPEDRGAFKTPTLREISRTGPYMHDGSISTLKGVIEFYDRGGLPNPGIDSRMRPLHLSKAQKRDLLAFLNALSGSISEGQ